MSGPQVVAFAKARFDQQVGSGECFDLADQALKGAKDKSAADFGVITPDADYVWGTKVALGELLPGDIVQFRDYKAEITVERESETDVSSKTTNLDRPHHTAIVESVGTNGKVVALEQNVLGKRRVMRNTLYFKASTTVETVIEHAKTVTVTTTVTVSGTLWYYRPVKK